MIEFFWVFSISVTVILIVFLIAAMRRGTLSWAWNLLIVLLVLAFGLFKLTGSPRDVWLFSTVEGVHGEVEVVYHSVIPQKFIYLLLRQDPAMPPYYVRLPWSKEIEQQMKAAAMKATAQRTPLMVNADLLSKGHLPPSPDAKAKAQGTPGQPEQGQPNGHSGRGTEGGDKMFYARPVQGDPDKVQPRSITVDRPQAPTAHPDNLESPDE